MHIIKQSYLIKVKSMGKTKYESYKAYLDTKTQDELHDIEVDLEVKNSTWNHILSGFFTVIVLTFLGFLGKLIYDTIKNSLFLYGDTPETRTLLGSLLPILIFFIGVSVFILVFLYQKWSQTKMKLEYIRLYKEEEKERSRINL